MTFIPCEVWEHIFRFINARELTVITPVCRLFRALIPKCCLWLSGAGITDIVVCRMSNLTRLDLSRKHFVTEHVLGSLTSITSLILKGPNITNISKLTNLRSLTTNISFNLCTLTRLQELYMLHIHESVSLLTNLTSLTTGSYGEYIRGLTNLSSLTITHTYVTGSMIAALTNLTFLDISYTRVQHVDHLTKLRTLIVSGVPNVDGIRDLKQLTSLDISSTKVNGDILRYLTNLVSLDVSYSVITDDDIAPCYNLQTLNITKSLVKSVPMLTNLTDLTISSISNYDNLSALQSLKYLSVSGCKGLSGVCTLTNLSGLNAVGTQITSYPKSLTRLVCECVSGIKFPVSLRCLTIVGDQTISFTDLSSLSNLKLLDIQCEYDAINKITSLTNLTSLSLVLYSINMSHVDIERALPRLRYLKIADNYYI